MRDHPQQDDGSTDDRARETYPIAELDSQWARMSGRERIQHLFDMQNPTDKRTSETAADAARVPANIQRLLDMQGPRSTDKPIPNGWETPGVKDHPQRPDPENIRLPDDRRTHILDGDPDGKGGGHRYGTGRPGKTEFPQRWDDDAVADHVLSTSRTTSRSCRRMVDGSLGRFAMASKLSRLWRQMEMCGRDTPWRVEMVFGRIRSDEYE